MIDVKSVLRQCPKQERHAVLLHGYLLAIYGLIETREQGRLVRLFTDQKGLTERIKSPEEMYKPYPMELARKAISRSIKLAINAFTDAFIGYYVGVHGEENITSSIITLSKTAPLGVPEVDVVIKDIVRTLECQTDIYRMEGFYNSHLWSSIVNSKYLK